MIKKIIFIFLLFSGFVFADDFSSSIYDLTNNGYSGSYGKDIGGSSNSDVDISTGGDANFGISASCTDIDFEGANNFDLFGMFQDMISQLAGSSGDIKQMAINKIINETVTAVATGLAKAYCTNGSNVAEMFDNVIASVKSSISSAQQALSTAQSSEAEAVTNSTGLGPIWGSMGLAGASIVANVSAIFESLIDGFKEDKSEEKKQEVKQTSDCVNEMTAYYTDWIINMTNQKLNFNTGFKKYLRTACSIAGNEANSNLSDYIVRNVAGINKVENITPNVALGKEQAALTEQQKNALKSDNVSVLFYDGVMIKGEGVNPDDKTLTPTIIGKRATLPLQKQNQDMLYAAFFAKKGISGSDNSSISSGFEKNVYSASADPFLTAYFLANLYGVYDYYANNQNVKDMPAEFIVNNICPLNKTISDMMINIMANFIELGRLEAAATTDETTSATAESHKEKIINESVNSVNAFLKVLASKYEQVFGEVNDTVRQMFNINGIVKGIIIPGYISNGAYSDIISMANRFYYLDDDTDINISKIPVNYVVAGYLYTLLTKTGYPNMVGLRNYLNENYAENLIEAVNSYIALRKNYELEKINAPAFESRMADIFYYTQSNALKSIKSEMHNEYGSVETKLKTRCMF